jgi:hypothetical protein
MPARATRTIRPGTSSSSSLTEGSRTRPKRESSAAELRGISEVGIVTDDLLAALERLRAGRLELWYGEVRRQEGLGFVGRKAQTLILAPTGRPWLPTGRPAESHPVEVALARPGRPELVVRLRAGSVEVEAARDGY